MSLEEGERFLSLETASWASLRRAVTIDRPSEVREAADGWLRVATAAERHLAVLEDGLARLRVAWRSAAGAAYVEVLAATVTQLRQTAEVARHNWHVMQGAAQTLRDAQLDFATVASAMLTEEQRTSAGRDVVKRLDTSYEQAVADLRPVPEVKADFTPIVPTADGTPSPRPNESGHSAGGTATISADGASARPGATAAPPWLPSPELPLPGPVLSGSGSLGGLPMEIGRAGAGQAPGAGSVAGGGAGGPTWWVPGAPGGGGAATGSRPGRGGGLRGSARYPAPGRPVAAPGTVGTPGRAGAASAAPMMAGVPAGAPGPVGTRPNGRAQHVERFPTSPQHAVPPVIGDVPAAPEMAEQAAGYVDEFGNRITIRRPRDAG